MRSLTLPCSLALCALTLGCDSQGPRPEPTLSAAVGGSARPEARDARSGVASTASVSSTSSGQASASASPPAASAASGPPPAMPSAVTQCESAGKHFGGFSPSVDELVRADAALPASACLKRDLSASAIRACAAKAGATHLLVSTDRTGEEKSGCQVTITAGQWQGRRFVVFFDFYRDGATFFGGARTVELQGDRATLFLDALGKHAELCPTTATTGKLPAAEDLPAGWASMPKELQAFLCGSE